VVSPELLPQIRKIPNTGKAQPGPRLLQAMPKVQTTAITVEDTCQISNVIDPHRMNIPKDF